MTGVAGIYFKQDNMQYKVLKANFHTHTSEQAGVHSYPHYDGFYYQDLIDKFADKHEELWLEIAGERLSILCHPFRYKGVDPYWWIKTSKSDGIRFIELGKQLETKPEELKQLCVTT